MKATSPVPKPYHTCVLVECNDNISLDNVNFFFLSRDDHYMT